MAAQLSFEPTLHQQVKSGPTKGAWVAIDPDRAFADPQKAEAARIRADGGVVVLADPCTSAAVQQAMSPLMTLLNLGKVKDAASGG